jgi:acetoacetyl-CoA synthetase
VDPARAVNPGAVDDPSLVEHYVQLAKDRAGAQGLPVPKVPR